VILLLNQAEEGICSS